MPKIDPDAAPLRNQCGYLAPYRTAVAGRSWRAVGAVTGIDQFGANLVTLLPGAWSSQRHWHSAEDELVVIISGIVILVENDGETPLGPGDMASFPSGIANGHHLQNRSAAPAMFLAIGTDRPAEDLCHYPDIDQYWSETTGFTTKPPAKA